MTEVKIHQEELDKVLKQITEDRMEWTEDLRSMIQEKAPQGVTGQLAGGFKTVHSDDQSDIIANTEYWKWVNYGAEWPNKGPPLKIIELGPQFIKRLGKRAIKDKQGRILVPIFWEWAEKVAGKSDPVDRYMFCWNLWRKFKREGMEGKYYVEAAIAEMMQDSNLYKISKSKYAEVKPR